MECAAELDGLHQRPLLPDRRASRTSCRVIAATRRPSISSALAFVSTRFKDLGHKVKSMAVSGQGRTGQLVPTADAIRFVAGGLVYIVALLTSDVTKDLPTIQQRRAERLARPRPTHRQ